ncbi:tetratricopeptide repeat-containing sensor histidine kinase [Carboxylicivirga sp. A043]|uniref:tetratricopeptide repeat-containing sensor histidine kinase n=1 Tax=Carboxylicivirga litoralis TaxID=2816963 RepID=UPI0021CB5D08|nr:tetratricopeptide repeat-containing sensor histidine kinase [Carboxylicivirga sp. A043]MCU4154471.1 tetratricopeptide repeat-containing sensor histidine kinase [Carboxylicivirga sp. A043]
MLCAIAVITVNLACANNNVPTEFGSIIKLGKDVVAKKELTFSEERKKTEIEIEKATLAKDTFRLAEAYFYLAKNQQLQGQNDAAYTNLNKALDFYIQSNSNQGIANCLDAIGSIFRYSGSYEKALEFHLKAKGIYTEISDTTGLIYSINNLGILYRNLNNYPQARDLYFTAIDLGCKTHSDVLATVYNSVGSFYWYQQKNDSALFYYRKALAYKPVTLELKERHCAVLNNIGNVYRTSGKLDSALYYYELSLKESRLNELSNLAAITLKNEAKVYVSKGWLDRANICLNKSIDLTRQSGLVKMLMENYRLQSQIHQKKGEFEESLDKYMLYSQLKDSVLSVDQLGRIAQLELDYTKQQLEKDKLVLKNNIVERDLEIERSKNYIYSFVYFTILLVLVVVVIYFRYLSNVKLKRKLQLLNEELEERVKRRTESLEEEIEEHKQTEKELLKSKQKAEEADQLKTAFLSNMSHEIRTPMNAIVGFSELLLEPDFEEEERIEFAQMIKSNGDTLLNLLNDIIDISMIESGLLKISTSRIIVKELMEQVYSEFQNSKEYKSKEELNLILDVPSGNVTITTDELRLKQILNNLVSNALKFTKEGYVKLGFQVQGKFVNFFVEDTGLGIDIAHQKQIFERFLKVKNDVSNLNRGNGLGLTITKNLVQLLNGTISLSSVEGKGSHFSFRLPI